MFIPVCALQGDNIVHPSEKLSWYTGETLLHYLENCTVSKDISRGPARFPVQYVIRPQLDELHDYRGYAGKIISGVYTKGQQVLVLPEGIGSVIEAIEVDGTEVELAAAPQSVVLRLKDAIDISRGDIIVVRDNLPTVTNELEAVLCWMDSKPLLPGNKYLLQVQGKTVRASVKEILYKLDVHTLEKESGFKQALLNDIVRVLMKTASPIVFDAYNSLRLNGVAILVDETSYHTVAGCMLQ